MNTNGNQWLDTIITGDALEVLQTLPNASIDCIVTSPPYYMQRDYSTSDQLGNEKTPDEYVNNLKNIFHQCRRVLKNEGTLWLNLGDKYHDSDLLGMPWKVAFALKDDGWILRSDII